ncbi:MAG: hypothetical protein ABI867_15625 [Kofleriaceae bacterium]
MRSLLLVLVALPRLVVADPIEPPPQNVPPTLLEGMRVAGDRHISPDDVTKTEIQRSGKTKIVGSFKLCIDIDGKPTGVATLKSTGFPAYDAKLTAGMRQWRYRPYTVNGKQTTVCTAITFVYSQQDADPGPLIGSAVLEKLRTAGAVPVPEPLTEQKMFNAKVRKVDGLVKVCVGPTGVVVTIDTVKSTGYPDYDAKLLVDIQATWQFKPYLVAGTPSGACAMMPISYNVSATPPTVPPPLPPPPTGKSDGPPVPPAALEALRLTGSTAILPDAATKVAIARTGADRIVGSFKLCVDATGTVGHVSTLKTTRHPDYDAKISSTIGTWTFKPYAVNGKPIPVCTAVTVIYATK